MGLFGKSGENAAPGDSPAPGAPDLAETRAEIAARRRKSSKLEDRLTLAQQEADLEALYQSENWQDIAALYSDTRYAMTGFKGFLLTDEQKARLAVPLATMMRLLIRLDPRWISLIIFSVNFGGTIAKQELAWRLEKEAMRREAGVA